MKHIITTGLILASVLGATPAPSLAAPPAVTQVAAATGDEKGARELVARFVAKGADTAALTRALQPTAADYQAVFTGPAAARAQAHYTRLWASLKGGIGPKPGQTQVLLVGATTSDLMSGTGKARDFPGGWRKAAPSLKPGLTFYRFKFVEPGKTLGMAFDGLVFVNGHWALFPKPWQALGD